MPKKNTFKCPICKKIRNYPEYVPKGCRLICDYCKENQCSLLTSQDIKNIKKISKNISKKDLERMSK